MRLRDGKESSPARDCKELFEHNPKLDDGFYWVDPDGKYNFCRNNLLPTEAHSYTDVGYSCVLRAL